MDKRKKRRINRKRRALVREIKELYELEYRACSFYELIDRYPCVEDLIWQAMVVKTGYIAGIKKLKEKYPDFEINAEFLSGCVLGDDVLKVVYDSAVEDVVIEEEYAMEIAAELELGTSVFAEMLLEVYKYFGWECDELLDESDCEAYIRDSGPLLSEAEQEFVTVLLDESFGNDLHLYAIRSERLESFVRFIQQVPGIKEDALVSDIIRCAKRVGNPLYTYYEDFVGAFDMNGAVKDGMLGSRFYFSVGYLEGWEVEESWYRFSPLQFLWIEVMERLLDFAELYYPEWSQSMNMTQEIKVS